MVKAFNHLVLFRLTFHPLLMKSDTCIRKDGRYTGS